MSELVQIGSIYRAHGVKGVMKMRVVPEFMDDLLELEAVFIDTSKGTLPHFIRKVEAIADDMALLQLEEVDSKEKATALIKCAVLARDEDLSVELEEWESLEGYFIIDHLAGEIGVITEIMEMPHQDLAKVQYQGRAVLIPIHEDLVTNVDETDKKIYMQLPEGFFEVF